MILYPFDKYFLLLSASIIFFVQVIFFFFAYKFKTDKVTDLSYGLTFIVVSVVFYVFMVRLPSQLSLVYLLIDVWAIRLSAYLFIRVLKIGKDYRFDERRSDFKALLAFWGLQAVSIWIIMLPFTVSASTRIYTRKWGFFENVGILLWIIGFLIETVADYQKFIFKSDSKNKDKWMQTGLWAYSQHPNYFGEILIWFALFVIIIPILEGWYWLLIVGPLFITILITKISGIPLLQASANKKYGENPDYRRYKWNTNILIPFPQRRQ